MPVTKRKAFSPDAVVEVIESHAVDIDGVGIVLGAGTRVRADHPAVKLNPMNFAPIGTPHDEIADQLRANREVAAVASPPPVRTRVERRLRDEDAVVPTVALPGIPAGTRLAKDDDRVRDNAEAFVPVVAKGRTRANSYLALSTLENTDNAGKTRRVHAGTWVAQDDPFVELHPHQFGLLLAG